MNYETVESILYKNACGKLTARQTGTTLLHEGAKADLRTWINNTLDIFDLAGDFIFTAEI